MQIGSSITQYYDITCGVPQGACLSPTLFSIFINDLPINDITNDNYSLLFADDLSKMKMFTKINAEIEKQLNNYLRSLEAWLNNWQLKMAPEKCNYIIFSLAYKAGEKGTKGVTKEKFDLTLYGEKLKINNSPIFLGMRFDKHLCFKNFSSLVMTLKSFNLLFKSFEMQI